MTFVEDLLFFKVATGPSWVVEEEPCWFSCDPLLVNKPLSLKHHMNDESIKRNNKSKESYLKTRRVTGI